MNDLIKVYLNLHENYRVHNSAVIGYQLNIPICGKLGIVIEENEVINKVRQGLEDDMKKIECKKEEIIFYGELQNPIFIDGISDLYEVKERLSHTIFDKMVEWDVFEYSLIIEVV